MRTLLLVLAVLLAPGCFITRKTDNKPLDAARLSALKPGTSTAREAVELLGAPVDVVQLGKRSAYEYRFTNTKRAGFSVIVLSLFNQDTRSDRAWLFFDENQLLTHMGTTLQGGEPEYAMPWQEVHD